MEHHHLSLTEWRRKISELYSRVRQIGDSRQARELFILERDQLFANQQQSPLNLEQRVSFEGLNYFEYKPAFNVLGQVEFQSNAEVMTVELPVEGALRLRQVATVHFSLLENPESLGLFWIEGYGGGLFLPFRDNSNGRGTYSGGRYLYDTIKGADLGDLNGQLILDFNFAYNPSCAYNDQWVCPLAPAQNRLNIVINAGEKSFS